MPIVRPVAVLALLTAVAAGPLSPVTHAALVAQASPAAATTPAAGTTPAAATHQEAQRASTTSKSAVAEPVGRNGVKQTELLQIAYTLQATAPAATYSGVAVDPAAGMVDVYLTDLSAAASKPTLASVSTTERSLVRLHRAPLTRSALKHAVEQAGVIGTRLAADHVPLQTFGPDFEQGVVRVGLFQPTAAQSAATARAFAGLPTRIAADSVKLRSNSLAQAAPASLTDCTGLSNRACDSAPWTAGDFIRSNTATCTDSWPISMGGKTYMLTAGHCALTADTFYNGVSTSIGSNTTLGVVSHNLLQSNAIDAQLIQVASAKQAVWSGTYPADTPQLTLAQKYPVVGEDICAGGAYDGTICTGSGPDPADRANRTLGVSMVDQCSMLDYSFGPSKACGLAIALGPKNQVLAGAGDSGGPVYEQSAGGVTPLGIVTAGNSAVPCTAFPYRNTDKANGCGDDVIFTALGALLSYYPGAVVLPSVTPPSGQPGCQDTVQPADPYTMIDFYHASSLVAAENIRDQGIDPSLGSTSTDFGAGFYITTDLNQAIQWATLPSNNFTSPTITHFQIPAALLKRQTSCGRVFQVSGKVAPTSDFLNFVRGMRTAPANPGGAGYDFVEGPLLLNPNAYLHGAPPITGGQQDAIFVAPHNLAAAFDAGYMDMAPAGSPASWIVGHAQHAGNDYPYETVGQFGHTNEGTDAWNEYYGQCDSFAAWKVYENLSVTPQRPSGPVPAVGWVPSNASVSAVNQFASWAPGAGPGGNADVWSTQAQNWGAAVDNIPTPGAIAWWPNAVTDPQDGNPPDPVHGISGSATGHVGYVTDVYPDGSITVEGYNMRENGEYSVVHMKYNTGYTDNSFSLSNFDIPWPGGFIHLGDGPAQGVSSPAEPSPGVVQATYPSQVTVLGPGDGHGDFSLTGSAYPGTTNGWYPDAGHGEIGQELWTSTHPGTSDSTATWAPRLVASTCYRIDAFVPDQWSNNDAALYIVADQHFGSSLVPVDENDTTSDWVQLGIFQAQGNGTLPVTLTDQGSGIGQIAADAMRYIPQSGCSGLVRASETIDYSNGTQLGGASYPGTTNGWYASAGNGQLGNQYYTYTNGPTPSGSATWTASVIPNACYKLFAYVPGNHADDYQALYTIGSGGSGYPTVSVDENAYTNNFAGLGTYRSTSSGQIVVVLTDQSPINSDAFVSADTMSFVNIACSGVVEGAGYPALTEGPGSPLSQFSLTSDWYSRFGHGDLGYEKWTNTHGSTAVSTATWTFAGLPTSTTYSVCAFIPDNYANNTQAHYQGFQGTSTSATFDSRTNQATATGWTYAGVLATPASVTSLRVVLDDTGPTGTYTAADAVKLTTGSC